MFVSFQGLSGDVVVNKKHHGGPDQAVYGYREEDYIWWSEHLKKSIKEPLFGENLTLTGLSSFALPIGAQLVFKEVVLEVTAPRIPCQTLSSVMGDNQFGKDFAKEARSGFYFRVKKEGYLVRGDAFSVALKGAHIVTTVDLFEANYQKLSEDRLEEFLSAPIDMRTRAKFAKKLDDLRKCPVAG